MGAGGDVDAATERSHSTIQSPTSHIRLQWRQVIVLPLLLTARIRFTHTPDQSTVSLSIAFLENNCNCILHFLYLLAVWRASARCSCFIASLR